jgi:CMP/dCMP kinase
MASAKSIVISGDLGSGKSTISFQLADRLNLRRVSMGDIYREIARTRELSAFELGLQAQRDEAIDDHIDRLQAEMARSDENLIVDSRLAWHFFKNALKVHLVVDPYVAAQRVLSRPATSVESYSSVTDAVEKLQGRSNGERMRFIRRYGIDKARLRNYDVVCDRTSAPQDEVTNDIIAALEGTVHPSITRESPPLLLIDPKRLYPTRDIRGPHNRATTSCAAGNEKCKVDAVEPISVVYTGRYFYVVDGHRRLSTALLDQCTLIAGRLVAEDGENVVPGLTAQGYFESETGLSEIRAWEAAHGIELSLPPHLAD